MHDNTTTQDTTRQENPQQEPELLRNLRDRLRQANRQYAKACERERRHTTLGLRDWQAYKSAEWHEKLVELQEESHGALVECMRLMDRIEAVERDAGGGDGGDGGRVPRVPVEDLERVWGKSKEAEADGSADAGEERDVDLDSACMVDRSPCQCDRCRGLEEGVGEEDRADWIVYAGIPELGLPDDMRDLTFKELIAARRALRVFVRLAAKHEAPISHRAYGVCNRLSDSVMEAAVEKAGRFPNPVQRGLS